MTKANIEQQRKFLLGLQCVVVFIIFFSIHYSNIGEVPSFTPWLLVLGFVLVAYLRVKLHQKYYIIRKMGRTKNLALLVRLLPVAALLAFLWIPSGSGINGVVAGIIAALYFYIEDTLTIYTPIDEYKAEIAKKSKKKKK